MVNGLKGLDIGHELHHAFPKRLRAWVSVALAAEEAPETGHDADPLAEGGWRLAISQAGRAIPRR